MAGCALEVPRSWVTPSLEGMGGLGSVCEHRHPHRVLGTAPPRWVLLKQRLLTHSCPPLPPILQIAPAEGPDATERMVIITGPPEAQFKVGSVLGMGVQLGGIPWVPGVLGAGGHCLLVLGCGLLFSYASHHPPTGPGANIWKAERRELLQPKRRGEA